jgi:hypothetical protein
MRRAVAAWVFVPVACLSALVFALYLGSSDEKIGNSALLHGSTPHSKAEAVLKQFHSDEEKVVRADHALHAAAAASLPHSDIPSVVVQHKSAESAVPVARVSVKDGLSSPRRNRPAVAQHFVQLARQWVARVEPLQHKLAPLQHQLAVYDQNIALVKQHLAEAESQRVAVDAALQLSLHSVDAAKRLLENSPAEKIALEHKMVRVANQISAASGTICPPLIRRKLCTSCSPPHPTPPSRCSLVRVWQSCRRRCCPEVLPSSGTC